MYHLDSSVKAVWSIRYIVWALLLSAGAFYLEWQSADASIFAVLPFGMLTGLVLAVGLVLAAVVPMVRYRHWAFELRPEELVVQHGVFNRVRTVAPVRRVQHIDVSQNVLESMFGIGKLIIYTAGTRGADIVIPGLIYEYAEDLRDQLKNNSLEDAV